METKITNDMDWSGWLVQSKKEMLNPNELQLPYVVLEDRGPRILVQLLPEYQKRHYPNLSFPCMESGLKDWYEVIDTEIQKI